MATLVKIKKDKEFYGSLSGLLKVLKGIAVSQYQILERKIKLFDKFSYAVNSFLLGIETKDIVHPFINPTVQAKGVVAITSDSGLLGGLNMQVMKRAFEELKGSGDMLFVVGERGKIYAREEHIPYTGFPGIKEEERLELSLTVRDHVLEKVMSEKIGSLCIIYPRALSLTVQRIEKITPVPYGKEENPDEAKQLHEINLDNFIQESSLLDVVEYLVYLWLGHRLYEIFGEAKLAELAARFMHLEESSHRLEDLDKELRLKYFRLKHELTDASMREIFASRLIHTGKH
ncbi:MAG: F0F1 ATP synthase subunit gamma [Candidatus Omnitrophica bacterium]|nr:F0F1 ATP synthase subunit gamma [Candidatus Omnitrophota bacterium]